MKKSLLFSAAIMLIFMANVYSQAVMTTGTLNVDVSKYGRIRLITPGDAKRQIERASILVGTSATGVFDYTTDATNKDATVAVTNPALSNFEITGSVDNGGAAVLPNVIVKYNVYGWTNGAYAVVKFNVKNLEANPINATIALDIIPYINAVYGLDTVTYNTTAGVIRFHRGLTTNAGIKVLSAPLKSLFSFEWYDGYAKEADYWTWMNKGTLQPRYISTTADGPVSIAAQSAATIAAGASVDVYYALAIGATEQEMLANITAASQKYTGLFTAVNRVLPSAIGLKNYPNPVKSSTKITYQLPKEGMVALRIYDALGNVVATLANSKQTGGMHTIDFDAKDLARGVYSYKLIFGDQVTTSKMIIVK